MSTPIHHHFLGKSALLSFFESKDKPGFIWLYQRDKDPKLTNTKNVAQERYLYAFTRRDGTKDVALEDRYRQLEEAVWPILKKFNNADGPIIISGQEKTELAFFIAHQATRTPAFRKSLKDQAISWATIGFQTKMLDTEWVEQAINEFKQQNPLVEIDIDQIRNEVGAKGFLLKVDGQNYFLDQAVGLGGHIFQDIVMKDFGILRSPGEFVTSDHPVSTIPNPRIPWYLAGGFKFGGIFFPIGSRTALFLKNTDSERDISVEHSVGFLTRSSSETEELNKLTIENAERFLYAGSKKVIYRKSSKRWKSRNALPSLVRVHYLT